MPQIVETDVGEIEFPDDYTQDQMRDVLRSKLPVFRERLSKGRVSDLASRLPRDVAVSGADTLQGLARGWQQLKDYGQVSGLRQMGALAALTSPVGEEHAAIEAANAAADEKAKELEATREERLKQNPLYKFGEESAQNAREFYKTNPTFDQSIPAMLSQALGSTVPVVASALTGPAAPYVGGLLYGAQSGQQGAKEAIEKGQPEKADEAYLAYAGLGAISEALMGYPIAFLRKVRAARQAGVSPDEFGKSLLADVAKRGVREAVEGFAREGTQESLEQIGQNISAREIGFDPERPVTQGAGQAFLIGGAVGAGLGGVGGAAMAIDEASPKAQLGRELERMGQLDFDPRTLDAIATGALSPQNATRTLVPVMLREPTPEQRAAETAGLPIPIIPAPAPEAPPQLTAEQLAAEEAAAIEAIRARRPPVEPYFSEGPTSPTPGAPSEPQRPPPRRRSPAPAPEEERATRVPKNGTKVTPPPVPISENAQIGYTPTLTGPPEAPVKESLTTRTADETSAVPPEAQEKGVATAAQPVTTRNAKSLFDKATSGLSRNDLEAVVFTFGDSTGNDVTLSQDGQRLMYSDPEKLRATGNKKLGATVGSAHADFINWLNSDEALNPDIDPMTATAISRMRKLIQPQEPNAIPIRSPETLPLGQTPESSQTVVPQIRSPERPAAPQETPKAAQVEPEKKAAEEQFESDLVVRARDLVRQSSNPEQAYDQLVQLYESIPRLGTRTAQSKTAQAYSTPPPLAFLSSHLAGVTPDTRGPIVEPTAGNGMLLIGTGPNATIIANELDPNRNARLIKNFPRSNYSMLDATSQDFFDYLSQWKPKHLLMNPPFGGRVEEGGQAKQRFPLINPATAKSDTPSIDLAIALNSLETMAPDGRAVIIIGSKTGTMGPQFSPNSANRAKDYNRPEMLEFFQRFNVTDWFTVSGKLYEKMGAGWPVDVIVINGKRGTLPTAQGGFPRPWVTPPKVYNSWAELKEKLYETPSAVRTPAPPIQQPTAPVAPTEAVRTPGGISGQRPGRTSGAPLREPGSAPAGLPDRTTRVPQEPGTPPAAPASQRLPDQAQPEPGTGRAPVVPPSSPEPATSSSASPESTGGAGEAGASAPRVVAGSNLLNVPFKPVSKLGGGDLVAPKNLADSMARAVEQLERDTGQSVDDYVAQKLGWTKAELKQRFSAAQAEAVALFIRNLESRATGLINSDQTGVGKGRSVAAAIHYAIKNGKIPIFVTAKKQLYSDMAGRDLPAIGIDNFNPFITDSKATWTNGKGEDVRHDRSATEQREAMAEIARNGKLPTGVNGIFTTYDQLKSDTPIGFSEESGAKAKRKKSFTPKPDGPRFQMLRALAPNAVFILDEAHLAAGQDSDVGLSLQSILPSAAGVYYASATFAKRPDNLSLYALGTAMKKAGLNRKELANAFASGGVPLQQALTSMLTESGEFVRREQNMEGVKFDFESTGTDPEKEAELADTYTSFLRDLFRLSEQINSAAEAMADDENQVRAEGEEVDLSSSNFGARLFNLSSQYLFSLRADATIQKAIEVLKAGRKPFIAVYNTMAGPIADLKERGLPINYAGMLEREMRKMLEVKIKDPLAPADKSKGLKKGQRLIILKPEDLSDGGAYYYRLLEQIKATDFSQMPISPIDTIKKAVQKAGFTIGEITGRKGEIDTESDEAKLTKRELRERNKILSDFNNGQLDAMIVNGSADTGVSAHTDPRFKDQRQRHMIIAQPNPDINGFMQIVGRVMRFGQTSKPRYTIIGTSLATERRFSTMLRAKLNSLNANTTADTESTITQGGLTDDIFNPIGDQVVVSVLAANPEVASRALINLPNPENPESGDNFARYATGRFVLLPNGDAEQLWREISETYAATIKALDDAGENPLRADAVDLRAKTTKSQTIQEGTGRTLFDGPVVLETADVKPPQPALTSEQALEMAAQGRETAEAKAQTWLSKYESALAKRVATMRQRESTDAQIDATVQNFQKTKDAVEEAVRFLGEPVAVRSAYGEGVDFYAVPIGLMLKSDNIGDFSGASKHSLILATNGIRRQITIPLSQIDRLNQADIQSFDSERDTSGVRYIVSGNLLRGVNDASKMSVGTSRPKVTIYSTADQQLKTGILMAPGWRPETGLRAMARVLNTAAELKAAIDSGQLVSAGPALIRGDSFSIPSRNEFRGIWGDPQFARLFTSSPIERRGEFEGELTNYGRAALFDFLRSKGIKPTVQPRTDQPDAKYSVTLSEPTGAPAVTPADIKSAFPASQGFKVRPVSMTMIAPDGTERVSNSFFIKLPNGQAILVDPTLETIHFDPTKAAADWGLDPETVAQRGVARGVYRSGGAAITGLSRVGLIELLNTSDPSTLSHEKFHALFDMVLTPDERTAILNRYKTEEKAAEAFRRSEGFTRGFWEKMRRFIEWLANFVRGDAFRKLRAPLSVTPSQPTGRTEPQFSLQEDSFHREIFRSKATLERFMAKPFHSAQERDAIRQQASAQSALVPDAIANEIKALDPTDDVEKRIADLLDFVVQLHGMAPALELKRILESTIDYDVKQAAISGVLRQIEHVRVKTDEIDDQLQIATRELASASKKLKGNVSKQDLIEARAKRIADNLIDRYRQYLTAQAANLPADQNLAAARSDLLSRMDAMLVEEQKLDVTHRALNAIAQRIDELPVAEGPAAVVQAIRDKGILRGVVGDDTIDLLTAEKPGGLPPLLLHPAVNDLLIGLADVQKRGEIYAKQIDAIEKAFRGKTPGEPATSAFSDETSPVTLRKWADTYLKFRNQQKEAARALADLNADFEKADQNVQVYGRSKDILTRLQNDPAFVVQFNAAINRPGGSVFGDIAKADENTGELTYISPLKIKDENGKEHQNTFKVSLRPDRKADQQTVTNMADLVLEIEQYLAGENVDPLEARTWRERMDYLKTYMLNPKFQAGRVGGEIETTYGTIRLNLWDVRKTLMGGAGAAPRSELERVPYRATRGLNNAIVAGDLAAADLKRQANNLDYGDEATTQAIIKAAKSHGWDETRLLHWNQTVLNPILAAGQNLGQMRLKAGDYIPGTGIQITEEDMAVALKEKRYSQAVVATTQGTSKTSPTLIQQNPILIEDQFAGRTIRRGAISPGPLTMARRFSQWGETFSLWWKGISDAYGESGQVPTYAEKRRRITDGEDFQGVLRYVTTTNPEFKNTSKFKPVYEAYTAEARTESDHQVQSLDQLLDRLASIAVSKGMFETTAEAKPEIEAAIIAEMDSQVEAFYAQVIETRQKRPTEVKVESVQAYASANNPFTKARVRMVASDAFYDYTLSTANDRLGFSSSAYQMFQLNQLTEMEKLVQSLTQIQSGLDGEITRLEKQGKGMSRRRAMAIVQKRTRARLGDAKFTYIRLVAFRHTLEKILKSMSELVIDQRDANDSLALHALARFRSTVSSALLSQPAAVMNNMMSGIFPAQYLTMQNIGRANVFMTPLRSVQSTAKVAWKQLLDTYPSRTAIGAFARTNMPLVKDMAQYLDTVVRDWVQIKAEMREAGLLAPTDMKNRMRNMAALKKTAGRFVEQDPKLREMIPNYVETFALVRWGLAQLRDKVPRKFDEQINLINAESQDAALFDWLKLRAKQLFDARAERAARTGRQPSELNDFRFEENLISPDEMQMGKGSGFRDLDRLRVLFDPIGSLDNLLLDYYTRLIATPESERHTVELFRNQADKGAILYNLAAHANVPTSGFTPPGMQGVGQRGLIKSALFMFLNYPVRMSDQLARVLDYDPRDPKARRLAYLAWSSFAILLVSILAGMAAGEAAAPLTKALTGRDPARITLGNLADDPDAAMFARYTGSALANNLPYYGQIISQMLGNPGYGSWWDAADIVPAFGMMRDTATAVKRMKDTGTVIYPGLDFVGRWFPPAATLTRFLPDMQGDIEAKNAMRALRVVGPSVGIELATPGGGVAGTQTPSTIAMRRLMSAAYRGDRAGIEKAFADAVREKKEAGAADPERSVIQSLASSEPARRVFGRGITPEEETRLLSKMSAQQRKAYAGAQQAFGLINETLGTSLKLTSTPSARTRGQATRRALFSESASPIFATRRSRSRRRRLSGRRRSAFRRLQSRGSSRRRRRSPARFSFAA